MGEKPAGKNIFEFPSKLTGKCESKRVFVDLYAKVPWAASRSFGCIIGDSAPNSIFPFSL